MARMDLETGVPTASRRKRKAASPWRARWEKAVQAGLPFLGQYGLYLGLLLLLLIFFGYFKQHYYRRNPVFTIHPREITLHGNAVLSREFLLDLFHLSQPTNSFDLVSSDIIGRLQRDAPLIKQAQMTYEPGKGLEVWVEERTPIARLANNRHALAVDEEGVCFTYPAGRGDYPVISGFDLPEEVEPGMRLQENLKCMLHLISATAEPKYRLPSRIQRVTLLGNHPDDGLLLSLADGRRVMIAWEGMADESGFADGMLRRLEAVARLLRDPLLEGKRNFNAFAPDRVAVSD